MSWVAVAIGAESAVGGAASYFGAKKQANAAENAADLQHQQYLQSRTDLQPWVTTGGAANARLAALLGIAPTSGPDWAAYLKNNPDVAASSAFGNNPAAHYEQYGRAEGRVLPQIQAGAQSADSGSLLRPFTGADLATEPGYQFGLQQGEQGINRAALSRGGYDSGATLKALTRFNQDYGGTKYGEAFSRNMANKNSIYGMLSGQSGQGANAAGQTAGLGANAAGAAGGFMTNAGDANAAGFVGTANALTSGVGSYLGYKQNQGILDYLSGLRGSSLSGGGSSSFAGRM